MSEDFELYRPMVEFLGSSRS